MSHRGRVLRTISVAAGFLIGAYALMVYRGETYGGLARRMLLSGMPIQRTERVAKRAHELVPEDGDFTFLYGLTLWEQNKEPDTVLALFDRALLTSTNTRVPIAKGTLLLKLDRHEQAYRVLQEVARYEAALEGLHYSRGLIFFLRGRYRQAVEELETEVRLYPDSYQAYIYLGLAYQQIGKTQLAIESLKGALRVKPRGLEALIQLGEVYAAAGSFSLAERQLEKAMVLAREIGDWETATAVEARIRQIRLERNES